MNQKLQDLERSEVHSPFVAYVGESLLREGDSNIPASSEESLSYGSRFLASWVCKLDDALWRELGFAREQYWQMLRAGDQQGASAALSLVRQLVHPLCREDSNRSGSTPLVAWAGDLSSDIPANTERRKVEQAAAMDRARFFDRYLYLKSRSGLETIEQVADAAGVSKSTIVAIEKRRVRPQFRTLCKIANAFGVDVRELAPDE